ncbi:hypothetical protein BLA29_013016 [Euroglyphus maynei]|uniref:Uncharacterized protein n=1 Tax=Euroglyphus maynei TaxID=6958 RepID=A0A1Y3B1N4_EURMA|nr:hypothetical protein BLA29_013016 [Euroglyphus maynei]
MIADNMETIFFEEIITTAVEVEQEQQQQQKMENQQRN